MKNTILKSRLNFAHIKNFKDCNLFQNPDFTYLADMKMKFFTVCRNSQMVAWLTKVKDIVPTKNQNMYRRFHYTCWPTKTTLWKCLYFLVLVFKCLYLCLWAFKTANVFFSRKFRTISFIWDINLWNWRTLHLGGPYWATRYKSLCHLYFLSHRVYYRTTH